ncbi:WAP four-disulfide core domain protein 18-like, partial [Lingula anatina]|uniref:WAP four-disulfide core domain protein 18-like n=1 Tax=Lingula anatina TaxID=7574 RepID=A0A2R2MTL6_LINAN
FILFLLQAVLLVLLFATHKETIAEWCCPDPPFFGFCWEGCTADSNCTGIQLCCSNGCGHLCMDPVDCVMLLVLLFATCEEGLGAKCCPEVSGFGTCVEDCDNCAKNEMCCSNGCGHVCMKPVNC